MTIRVSPSAENVPGVSGQSGKYLTTDGQSLSWGAISAGAFTEITTTTINNTVTSYTYSSLGSYKHIFISGSGLQYDGSGNNNLNIRFNGDTGSNYNYGRFDTNTSGSTVSGLVTSGNKIEAGYAFGTTTDTSERFGNFNIWIYDYRGSGYKSSYFSTRAYPGTNQGFGVGSGYWNNTAAITSVTILTALGNNLKAGIIKVYGVN